MDYFWQLHVSCSMYILVCVCVLIHLVQLNDSVRYDDLKVACGIKYKPVQDMYLDTVPDACTSVILNSKDFPGVSALNSMMSRQRNLPVLLIVDDIPYDLWLKSFSENSQDIKLFIDTINKYNLDGLIFDNLYPDQKLNVKTEINPVITENLPAFLNTIKTAEYNTQGKIVFLGIVIPSNPNMIINGFSYYSLDSYVDVYILYNPTNYYKTCTELERPLSPTYKVENTVKSLYSSSAYFMNKQKVLMESQLYVKDSRSNQELSYGETCHLCPGTKVCRDSLKSIYQKARLMNAYRLLGTYVRYCNQDDIYGQCHCSGVSFPGVNAIAAGIRGNEVEYVECASYGVPGVYWPNGECGYPPNAGSQPPDALEFGQTPIPVQPSY